MAKKPPMQVHVTSSDMKALLQAQKDSLASLQGIESSMKMLKLTELANLYETKKIDDENAKEVKTGNESLKLQKEHLRATKDMAKGLKEAEKARYEEAEHIAQIAQHMQTFKTIGDRFKDMGTKLKDAFGSVSALKVTTLKAFNVGGIFNRAIAKEKFVQEQRKLGSDKSRSELMQDWKGAQRASKDIKKNEAEITKFRKETGLSESELGKTKRGKELIEKRTGLAEEYAKHDIKASLVRRVDEEDKKVKPTATPTQQFADSGADEERAVEADKQVKEQSELLEKIEKNTRGASPEQKLKPKEEEGKGGGLLSGLLGGGKIGNALKGMKDFGIGLMAIAGALWVASKALKSFADLEWETIGKGMVALAGLVASAVVLDKLKGSIIKGAAVLGVLSLAVWGVSAAMSEFSSLDWETIGKGMVTIAGLGTLGVILGAFAPEALLGAVALGALGAGLWVVGKAMQEVGEAFSIFTENIEKLANIGGMGLLEVAGGMTALGLAMAAFGAGNVVAGLSNLVTGFLSAVTGQKTPIEQLMEISKAGPGIEAAGKGMTWLAQGMTGFNKVDGKALKELDKFPWERATKFVSAGGTMSVDGTKVYNASSRNADEAAKADGAKAGGGGTVVAAPVTNNNTNNIQAIRMNIRNPEMSQLMATGKYKIPYAVDF